MSEQENDPIEQVMSKVTRSEAVTRRLGGLFSQAGFLLNTVSRQIASRGRVLEAEMRLLDAKSKAGEPFDEPGFIGTATTTLFAGVQSISEELATHRALVFKRVVDLLGVGRDRLELREYLAERRWAEVEDPTAQEATARELILSTPGMEGFIKSQVEIEALWIGLIVADDFAEGRTRKRKKKAD